MARRQHANSVQKWPKISRKHNFVSFRVLFMGFRAKINSSLHDHFPNSEFPFYTSFCRYCTVIRWPSRLDTSTRSTRAIQTATVARLLRRHQCGVSLGTTIPIARLARLCGQQSEGLTPCSSSSPTNLTTFDPAHLHSLTHQPPSHTPPRRPTVGPILRSKQVPSHLRRTQFRGGKVRCVSRRSTCGSDNLDNELVETESHQKGYHFGSSRTSLVCFGHICLISPFPPRR